MASAELIFHSKRVHDDGAIAELKIWVLSEPVVGSTHRLKYSLYYGRAGERLVGYDNERGKGDHRHYGDQEEAYAFTSVEQLTADFEADVAKLRGDKT
ncbi:DUF6516 family protein [Phenylobacterium sp.]|uniref:toxin-antitoxin system TumE family protein n=1 Tax=Phenylobacterium sp. TaxID=1871053 RepID=UPI0025E7588E|nr:DUF6516 family protein [Phenylobacterium sp.]MBX3484023.1 hypothetical protein [Phenylobacterium sp.]MCW5760429.1 hypothetical protein [Phenylobacterium sp.]